MSKSKQSPVKILPNVLPSATSLPTTAASVSDPPTPGVAGGASLALSTTPPVVTIPAPPLGFVPVNLDDYRGSHPKVAQMSAIPDAVVELKNATSYASTFGGAAPPATTVAADLDTAAQWTALRVAIEAYLVYVKSLEAVTWKTALADMDKLRASFKVVALQNPVLVAAFPATERLLDVTKVIGQKGAATRARKAKSKLAAATSTAATAAPVATPATATPATVTTPAVTNGATGGGATH